MHSAAPARNPLQSELDLARAAARAAGAAAMEFYGTTETEYKEGGSPVTEADHAANRVILERIRDTFPDDAILSEESIDSGARLDPSRERVWIIDPLDGTREFLSQNGEFAIMIGLVLDGEPSLGVVYLPDGDVLYDAVRGAGARVERDGRREPLIREPVGTTDASSLRLVGSRSHSEPLVESIRRELAIVDVQPCGSVGVKCARIADGLRDLYIHPVPYLKEWDTCAPEVVLREAGGTVSDCRGEPLRYNRPDPRQPHGILACAPGVAELVQPRVAELYRNHE